MKLKKWTALALSAALATCMLTGCPWEEEDGKNGGDTSSSSDSPSSFKPDHTDDSPDSSSSSSEPEAPATYTITVTTNGCTCTNTEMKDGKITVQEDGSVTLTFTPEKDKNYSLASVTVNNKTASFQKGSASFEYTFNNVQENQTIAVTFSDLGYTITTDENGKETYNVHDETGLKAWAKAAETNPSANCTLANDLNLTDQIWQPIGNYTGIFDGNNKTITGLTADVAMLRQIGDTGRVQNLKLERVSLKGVTEVAGIAQSNSGVITGCTVTGTLTATDGGFRRKIIGGIAAWNSGTITGCRFEGTIIAEEKDYGDSIGGIVGANGSATITDCTCEWTDKDGNKHTEL